MKRKTGNFRKIYGFILFLISAGAMAQTGSISGTAKDKATGEGLPGVTIILEGTTTGASADAEGGFLIQHVNPGVYTLKASYISYNSTTLENVVVESGKTAIVTVLLSQGAFELQDVTITAERKTNT